MIESEPGNSILFAHDLFGKSVSTFPDHALSFMTHDRFGIIMFH